MILVPSIALHHGKVARFSQGDFSQGRTYDKNPLDLAKGFQDSGVRLIHIVDLDGAKAGSPKNAHLVEMIAGHTSLKINFSGGIHTDGDISKMFENGASSVTCATMAVYQPDLFASWVVSYGAERIVLGADTLDGMIRVGGWLKGTKISLYDHVGYFHTRGLKYLKTTDISKEGSLAGPAIDLYKDLMARFPHIRLFASGGIRNMKDIYALNEAGLNGAIFGKCFYEGDVTFADIEKFHSQS